MFTETERKGIVFVQYNFPLHANELKMSTMEYLDVKGASYVVFPELLCASTSCIPLIHK
jgi:hypothetical protein